MTAVQTLFVVWQDEKTRQYFHIGTLSHFHDRYEFRYTSKGIGHRHLEAALAHNYMIHPAFPIVDKVYQSKTLFPAFARRIPDRNRPDYNAILTDLGLRPDASDMAILRATRGRLGSDTYSFEQPLRIEQDQMIRSEFFIHGMRHQGLIEGWSVHLRKGALLSLKHEVDIEKDPHAVAVYTRSGLKLGYVPAFYSQAVYSLIRYGACPSVRVSYVNESSHPHWWLKVDFESNVPSERKSEIEEFLPAFISV